VGWSIESFPCLDILRSKPMSWAASRRYDRLPEFGDGYIAGSKRINDSFPNALSDTEI
jgi:hypothetical protein